MPHWTSSNAFLSVHLQFVYQWGTLFNHVVDVIVKEWDSILYITLFIIIDDINNYIHKEKKKWKNRLWEVMPSIPVLTYVFSHWTHWKTLINYSLASTLHHTKYSNSMKKEKWRRNASKRTATARFFNTRTKTSRNLVFFQSTFTTRQCLMWSLLCN